MWHLLVGRTIFSFSVSSLTFNLSCSSNTTKLKLPSLDSFICKYDIKSDSECEVKGCKKCQKNKNHLCDECF